MRTKKKLQQAYDEIYNENMELKRKVRLLESEQLVKRTENEPYFFVNSYCSSDVAAEKFCTVDDYRYASHNYFLDRRQSDRAAEKIQFLLKLEQFHNIYCPDFIPNWNNQNESKYGIYYDYEDKKYEWYIQTRKDFFSPCFPSADIVNKVLDILNGDK